MSAIDVKDNNERREPALEQKGRFFVRRWVRFLQAFVPVSSLQVLDAGNLSPNNPDFSNFIPIELTATNALWVFLVATVMHNIFYQGRRMLVDVNSSNNPDVPDIGIFVVKALGFSFAVPEFITGMGGVFIPAVTVSETLSRMGAGTFGQSIASILVAVYSFNVIFMSKDFKSAIRKMGLPATVVRGVFRRFNGTNSETKIPNIRSYHEQLYKVALLRQDLANLGQKDADLNASELPQHISTFEQAVALYEKAAHNYGKKTTQPDENGILPGQVRLGYEKQTTALKKEFLQMSKEIAQLYGITHEQACETLAQYLNNKYRARGAMFQGLFTCGDIV